MAVVVSIAILFIIIFCLKAALNQIKLNKKDLELIKTVTSLERGTDSELRLILKLLKAGIPPGTIFHDLIIKKRMISFLKLISY